MSPYLRPVGPVRRRHAPPPMVAGIIMMLAITVFIIWVTT